MKISLLTTLWKRPALTAFTLRRFQNQKIKLADSGIDLSLVAVGSEGKETKELAENFEFLYAECENYPLNRKNNFGLTIVKEIDPDFMIFVNSDSVFSDNYFSSIVGRYDESLSVFGLRDLYNMNLQKRMLGYWGGWDRRSARYQEPIGTGRCYPREVLQVCNYQLWSDEKEIMRGLDYDCRMRLASFGVNFVSFSMNELGSSEIEVKTGENIWKWESLRHVKVYRGHMMSRIIERTGARELLDLASFLYPNREVE